jgi:hypothetical protein
MLNFYLQAKRLAMFVLCTLFTISSFAATFVVTNTNNSGPGSLSQAITDANATPGADVITFNLPVTAPCIINLTSQLPSITEALTINGYSQPGSTQGTIAARVIHVNINGTGVGFGDIFVVDADNVTISGLAIYKAPNYAINITPNGIDNVHIWGNYIGTDSSGLTTGLGNVQGGVISNYNFTNLNFNNNIVVGTNGDGTNDANEGNLVTSSTSVSGNDGDGIFFWKSNNSRISGNIVGLNKNGTGTGFGHTRDGIVITVDAANTVIGTDGNGVSDALEGNLVSRNIGRGILVGARSVNNVIAGNIIGLDANNNAAGNGKEGIEILNSSTNRIGTDGNGVSDALEANTIGSNTGNGIMLTIASFFGFEGSTNGNVIAGNYIGTDATGTQQRGNGGSGVTFFANYFTNTLSNNIVGTNYDGNGDAAEANLIAYNVSNGIQVNAPVPGSFANGNKFARNRIFLNGQLGIDLNTDGVTPNDDGDADAGGNDLFNAPVITSVQVSGGGNLIITGFTRPNSVVEFYIPDAGPNPAPVPVNYTKNFGEGQTFLFRAQDETTLNGIADELTGVTSTYDGTAEGTGPTGTRTENQFRFTIPVASLPVAVTAGTKITAIAYANATGAGNTSEFAGVAATTLTPVTMLYFKGLLKDDKGYITWATTDEINNSHFDVEKSTTGSDFVKVGTVNASGRSGNFTSTYNFVDNNVVAKVNYYRLKQVDIDGRSTYSKVLVLRNDLANFSVKIGPNPFAGNINVLYKLDKETTVQIRLYDQSGRAVKQYSTNGGAGANSFNISDLTNLPKGQYTLELKGDNVQYRQQVAKQ